MKIVLLLYLFVLLLHVAICALHKSTAPKAFIFGHALTPTQIKLLYVFENLRMKIHDAMAHYSDL